MRGEDLSGRVFGRLTVTSICLSGGRQRRWHCICVCGGKAIVRGDLLRRGRTKSCGCLKNKNGKSRSPEWRAWSYARGQGDVCERWGDFEVFLADVGSRPSIEHILERINPKGIYEPGNCHWVRRARQGRGRLYEVNGQSGTVGELARIYKIPYAVLWRRLKRGVPVEMAIKDNLSV